MGKLLVPEEQQNWEEQNTGKVSYKRLVETTIGDIVLCNNITDIDPELYGNIVFGNFSYNMDIFQHYICNVSENQLRLLTKLEAEDDIILAYCRPLDVYVLLVDHLGTSWDGVSTNVDIAES